MFPFCSKAHDARGRRDRTYEHARPNVNCAIFGSHGTAASSRPPRGLLQRNSRRGEQRRDDSRWPLQSGDSCANTAGGSAEAQPPDRSRLLAAAGWLGVSCTSTVRAPTIGVPWTGESARVGLLTRFLLGAPAGSASPAATSALEPAPAARRSAARESPPSRLRARLRGWRDGPAACATAEEGRDCAAAPRA